MTNPRHIVSENIAPYASNPDARAVKLFRNGANQAVRIPREFELVGTQALMRKVGQCLVIEPVVYRPKPGSPEAMRLMLAELAALGPCDDEFPDVDAGLLPPDDIDL